MDNDVSISRNKDGANDSLKQATKMEDKKEPADGGDGQRGDRSLIEVKPEIPVVDLVDAEEKTMVNTDPVWLKKYDTWEEVTTNGEGEKMTMKKESGDEDKTNKTAEGCKGGEIKTEADTLILEIDNTDNLDAYLERTKNKAKALKNESTTKHNLTVDNLEKAEKPPAECSPSKTEPGEENPGASEKPGDSTLASANASRKKPIKKEVAKKRSSTGKVANPSRPLSDESEKLLKTPQQKKEEPPPKKVQCKTEPTNDDSNCKNQAETEKKPNIERIADKPVRTSNDAAVKTEDKKLEPRFIWISNISKNTKATDLKLHLTSYGKVMTAKIVTDGKLYYGYVVMEKRDDVSNCIKNLDDTVFEGKKIRLSDRVPEKKPPSKNQDVEQIQVKTEPISPEQTKTIIKNAPEIKPNKEKVERKRNNRRSRSHDPLTLKVKAPPRRFDRFSEERRRRKNEEELRRKRERASEEQRRKREIEREREERRKQKIKEEEHRQTELKLERERKKLDRERELIERERLDLLRLQKKLADTERCMLSRQKVEIERNIRNISEDYKKRKSPGGFEEDNRKNKFARVEMEGSHRRPPEARDYWKSERRASPIKGKKECFDLESYATKKAGREENAGVAPPPPILTDSFDLSDRRRKEKEREWESRAYDKKEFSERPVFKERKAAIEEYNFGRECVQEKQYNRERYKPKYEKTPTGSWEKFSSSTSYKSVPSSASWRNDVVRVMQRHPPSSGFPVPPQYGSTAGMTHYYPQAEYTRPTEFYGRPPDRKY